VRTDLVVRIIAGLVVSSLIVPALAVTVARIVPGGGLSWVILRGLTPLAIIPYALAAAVLVGTTWGFHGATRSVAASVLAVVTTLLVLHVWWFTAPFLSEAQGSPSGATFTVMTTNLHIGRADPEAIVGAVDRYGVDVLVLEEITPEALAELDSAGLDRRLDHRAGAARSGRDGIMVFAREPLREDGEIATATPGYAVEMTTSRGPLRILAVHPTAPNNGIARWSSDLDTVVAAARASSGPTVVAGDFNATLDHPQILKLLGSHYRDASSDAGPSWRPTWPSQGSVQLKGFGLPSLFGLDHVFLRGPLEATYAQTRAVPGTDHRALVTRISWTDAASAAP
jgi:endonuclease/exonuclease/phosphatase (EEP) superfamily protein YafD